MAGAVGVHPNLSMYSANRNESARRHSAPDGTIDDLRMDIDSTPKIVAAIGLASIVLLFGLKAMGFRFALGVKVGR